MASISKRVSGAWQNTSYGIRATAMDTITTLPTTIYGDGTNATIRIKGNTVQTGTPTPDNPIIPQGCGELEAGQYKIPISSANTTTPVYLGEVETTRKVKKYVFTGNENFRRTSAGYFYAQSNFSDYNSSLYGVISSLFSHYKAVKNSGNGNSLANNQACLYTYNQTETPHKEVYIQDTRFTTADEFNSYLAAQYAAGTPVTVWYVLSTEETAVVNEPLMRIGDYADEVSDVSIPTTDGANTLSVDTTVQPSEVGVNYHGWHIGTVHERVSSEWD